MAYTYWKLRGLHDQNRIRFIWVLLIFHLYSSFVLWAVMKNKKERMIEKWYYSIGEASKSYGAPTRDRRLPADHKKNYVRYSNLHQKLRNKKISMIWTNWWCRDQNFRKYFEMRKRHNIRPAFSGFYHESIRAETARKSNELYQQRMGYKNL